MLMLLFALLMHLTSCTLHYEVLVIIGGGGGGLTFARV